MNGHRHLTASVFIAATDTGVGKTVVTAALAIALRHRGHSIGVMKPVETGVVTVRRSDAARLKRTAQVADPLHLIRPFAFRLPIAPLDAARSEKRSIQLSAIMQAYRRLRSQHDLLLVEGVGGVHVPITPTADVLDLIVKMQAPVLVIGRTGLGGVNHALLTLGALRQRKIPIIALVLNRTMPVRTTVARRQERSTVTLLRKYAGVPVIGPLPYLPELELQFDRAVEKLVRHAEMRTLTKQVLASARESRRQSA